MNFKYKNNTHGKTAPEIRTMLQNHEIDLGVISAAPFDESLLKQTNVMPDTLVLAFSKEHHFSKRKCIITRYRKERILLHRNPSTTRFTYQMDVSS